MSDGAGESAEVRAWFTVPHRKISRSFGSETRSDPSIRRTKSRRSSALKQEKEKENLRSLLAEHNKALKATRSGRAKVESRRDARVDATQQRAKASSKKPESRRRSARLEGSTLHSAKAAKAERAARSNALPASRSTRSRTPSLIDAKSKSKRQKTAQVRGGGGGRGRAMGGRPSRATPPPRHFMALPSRHGRASATAQAPPKPSAAGGKVGSVAGGKGGRGGGERGKEQSLDELMA